MWWVGLMRGKCYQKMLKFVQVIEGNDCVDTEKLKMSDCGRSRKGQAEIFIEQDVRLGLDSKRQ